MKKYAVYVSGNATRIMTFIRRYAADPILRRIAFVLIDRKGHTKLAALCKKHGIAMYEETVGEGSDASEAISKRFLALLRVHGVDYGFVFGDKILRGEILTAYKDRLINFHPSLLPAHKGLSAIDRALESGSFLLGNTAHMVTEEVDGGSVIMQHIFPAIRFSGYDEVLDAQVTMLYQICRWLDEDRIRREGNYIVVEDADYTPGAFIPNLETGA